MRKIILEMEYFIQSMIYQIIKFFKRIGSFYPEIILRPLFCFEDKNNTGLLIFNYLKQKKLIFNFLVNRNWKNFTDSRKRAKISAHNRKSNHPIETLKICTRKYAGIPNIEVLFIFISQGFKIQFFYSHGQYKMLWRLLSKEQNCPITPS